MRVLCSYSIKGGVGKTATAVNLAYLASQNGLRTLLIDLDPQAAATFYYRMDSGKHHKNDIFTDIKTIDQSLDDHVKASDFPGLNILPADSSFGKLERRLRESPHAGRVWQKKFQDLTQHYDLVILDCPPNLSLLSARIFQVSDSILSPVIPTTLSLRTLGQLLHFLKKKKKLHCSLLPFFSMVERRKKLHLQIIKYTLDGKLKGFPAFLKTPIPYLAEVEKMGLHRAPLNSFAANSPAGRIYDNLWQEIRDYKD